MCYNYDSFGLPGELLLCEPPDVIALAEEPPLGGGEADRPPTRRPMVRLRVECSWLSLNSTSLLLPSVLAS